MNSSTTSIMSDNSTNTENIYRAMNSTHTCYQMAPSSESYSIPPKDFRSLPQTNRYNVHYDSTVQYTSDEGSLYNLEDMSTTAESPDSVIDVLEWA